MGSCSRHTFHPLDPTPGCRLSYHSPLDRTGVSCPVPRPAPFSRIRVARLRTSTRASEATRLLSVAPTVPEPTYTLSKSRPAMGFLRSPRILNPDLNLSCPLPLRISLPQALAAQAALLSDHAPCALSSRGEGATTADSTYEYNKDSKWVQDLRCTCGPQGGAV